MEEEDSRLNPIGLAGDEFRQKNKRRQLNTLDIKSLYSMGFGSCRITLEGLASREIAVRPTEPIGSEPPSGVWRNAPFAVRRKRGVVIHLN